MKTSSGSEGEPLNAAPAGPVDASHDDAHGDSLEVIVSAGALPSGRSLPELERVIERGQQAFIDVGCALLEIRERRLYRSSHATFDAYCRERWGWTARHASRQMDAASVATAIGPMGPKPESEREARAMLERLEPEERKQVRKGEATPEVIEHMTATSRKEKLPSETRARQIRELAAEGQTLDQIARSLGLCVRQVRSVAKAHDIILPNAVIGKRARTDYVRLVRQTVTVCEGLTLPPEIEQEGALDALDGDEALELSRALDAALRRLRRLIAILRRRNDDKQER